MMMLNTSPTLGQIGQSAGKHTFLRKHYLGKWPQMSSEYKNRKKEGAVIASPGHCSEEMTEANKHPTCWTFMTIFLSSDPQPVNWALIYLINLTVINELSSYTDITLIICYPKWNINQEPANVALLDKFSAWLSHRRSGWAEFSPER